MSAKYLMLVKIVFIGFANVVFLWPFFALAEGETYPRIANYYLQPHVKSGDKINLSRYDLLIMDADVDKARPGVVSEIKNSNKDLKVFMYVPSQSVNTSDLSSWAQFRKETYTKVTDENWWLRDTSGNHVSFNSTWPTIRFVDMGSGWNNYLPKVLGEKVDESVIWDGIFYDMVFANLSWLNDGNIDLNRDGRSDNIEEVNSYWQKGVRDLLSNTKNEIPNFPVVINIDIAEHCAQNTNGIMMENFPASWLGDTGWEYLVDQYVNKLPKINQDPQVYIINSNTENSGVMDNYRKMRFGLTTTLLGNGYFSFDFGDIDHAQTWWYDEYEISLGEAKSSPYNLLDRNDEKIKKGLWRRNFENGIVLVNSTNSKQTYSFYKEKFEKINGSQDRRVNNGAAINWIELESKDGVVLMKINEEVLNNSFDNGSFARIFNKEGVQTRNGFFLYQDNVVGGAQVMQSDIDYDGTKEILVNSNGLISVFKDNQLITRFSPYNGRFSGAVSFAVADLNGDNTKEIITGAGMGGGPHVRVFNIHGKMLTGGFFAYNENFRGGVDVAVMDLNGDGTKEIITGAGPGGGPHIRVFTKDGRPLTGGFFAFDRSFRGGVTVATGDIDGASEKEIIIGSGVNGGSKVKIFTKDGNLRKEFVAYDNATNSGVRVMCDDLDNDGKDEIAVATIEY